ncbi:hypothetical protein B0H10DRAFT_2437511 [Mycena sp. CBHHK59/15]|nr:hypothetical protein B0H10DRAFT_2437511 [Mycena sp. CBHHK59/15]
MSLENSPFMDRINTNLVPSDPELEELRSFLTNPLNELARLDVQIADMHARVPHDVLQEIFMISCLPTEHNSLMDAREAPMLLGHPYLQWLETSCPLDADALELYPDSNTRKIFGI